MSDPTHDPATQAPEAADVLAFPASVAQQRFWYLELLQPGVTAFNVPMRFRLEGPLDAILLEKALRTIVERHESLRTHFEEDGGELLQVVAPEADFIFPIHDVSHLPEGERQVEADRLGSIEAQRPFHLATGPVFRAELVKLSDTSHILHVSVHHAMFDGSSMTVLTEELAQIYQAYRDGKECPLEPPAIQYGDYSVWQKDFLEGPEIARQLTYWKERLADMSELDLPTDRPRPAAKTWNGELISTLLPRELTQRLQAIASRNGATLFHLQLAAYKVLLHRYTGMTDIAVGSPITGRTRAEMERLIGVFINSLVLRSDLSGDPTFESLVRQVRDTALSAVENQDLPFECLVRELKPNRDPSRNPIFQVNFTHQRSFAKAGKFGGVELIPIPSRSAGAIFDLHFFIVERAEGWRLSCDFSTDLYDHATAWRMLGHYRQLLEGIAENPQKNLSELEILTSEEKATILGEWSRNPITGSAEFIPPGSASDSTGGMNSALPVTTIPAWFLETAEKHPSRTALVFGDQTITYSRLHAEATTLAARLINSGVKPGDLVALCSKPSPEMITGLLGILLAGGAYVPIDPDYPAQRFSMLLEDSGARVGLATPGLAFSYGDWNGTLLEIPKLGSAEATTLPPVKLSPEHPAYLLFTSGSTGKPKGVLVPHRGVTRLVRDNGFMPITSDDVFLLAAPLSFDASILEIWGPLLNGGTLVIPSRGAGLDEIATAVREKGVTTLWLTAGLFQVMIEEHVDSLKGLRYLLAGGDVLSVSHVRQAMAALPGTTLINGYGPTENTTFTTCHAIRDEDCERLSIPIGRPIGGTTAYILDDLGRPVPAGVHGELFTGGTGLALGYHGDPALTAEKFISHPQFGRLYRTGDLCRWLADGTIEFIGRRDHQVKIRGFRIELGEIETALASHPEVRQAKVAVRGESAETKRILAWASLEQGSLLDPVKLDAWLSARLPAFLRPDSVTILDTFPVTANGKIDLAALPDPARASAVQRQFIPPQGETEQRLAVIWSELLDTPQVGREDDFFALGGHSLMALRLFSRISREFGISLPLAALLSHPTIARLSVLLAPEAAATSANPAKSGKKGHLVTLSDRGNPPPLFCIHGGDGGVIFYRGIAERMAGDFPIHAIEALSLSSSTPIEESSVEETAAAYVQELLAVHATGPFRLAGYSFGGVVAHEMACQLVDQGHTVEFLGLFDTHNPTAPNKRYSLPGRFGAFWQQQEDLPLPAKLERLRARIAEGISVHRQVKKEVGEAMHMGPAEAHSDLRRVQVREENWRAMQAYKPRPYPGPITLFKAMTPSDKVQWPADYGWSAMALGGLRIVPVPGRHLTLFTEENIGPLAKALEEAIHSAEAT
ncbi:amino acid adenylation domain-containing protein [Luteolibacter flavescens]|uniref:Amino acid adenylation domain-containing protein n=1 Tax=Luteolibacter flavescens TaxID=1859460 RepID=A0ABT3FTQ5_9BACT|nr:non-ribosomal peptide synthetase [Luteolibacter flavescens]MCW1886943.1 amino acid adenylation domain-containing protein [Luteolibacter flavescens]